MYKVMSYWGIAYSSKDLNECLEYAYLYLDSFRIVDPEGNTVKEIII